MPKTARVQTLHDVEIRGWKEKFADLADRYHESVALLRETEKRLRIATAIKESLTDQPGRRVAVKVKGSQSQSTAVAVASDWHIEEHVDPKTVNGVNEFNLEIADRRATKFFQNVLALTEMCRTKTRIDTLVLALLGDFISGYIHEDLVQGNLLSPTNAIRKAHRLLKGGIEFLLEEGDFDRLIIPCVAGNHGRTTQRMLVARSNENNYEPMMYAMLADAFQADPRVQFHIAGGYFAFLDVYSTVLRFHHGHAVKYAGGVGGLTIPLNKAIAQWNKMKHADIDVLGHWHQRICHRNAVVNSSLIGYGAYALSIKAEFEPPTQSFFLIHPSKGKTVEAPIWLE